MVDRGEKEDLDLIGSNKAIGLAKGANKNETISNWDWKNKMK